MSKLFGGRGVLAGVDFDVAPAEVHALVGENGAGKSTLLNVITGVAPADAGEMRWEGRPVRLRGPRHARDIGIACVYQELALVPCLSAAENVFLGHLPARRGWVRWSEIDRQAARIFDELGHPIDPRRPVADLSLADRQLVEVARALASDARLILMDEPTAALSETDAERLRKTIDRLRRGGIGFVFVSHRLRDVLELADRITVLRDGKVTLSAPATEATGNDIVRAMAGPGLRLRLPRSRPEPAARVALRVRGPVDLVVHHGEVLGLAGQSGAGRTELLEWLFGARPDLPARVLIDGLPVTVRNPREAIRHGLALVPDDRAAKGLIGPASLIDNIVLAAGRGRFFIDGAAEALAAGELASKFRINASALDQPVPALSGGNQQKALLARWLFAGATVFLLDEPTRGVDLRSKAEIYELIEDLAARGAAVLLASSDVEDLLRVAHRIAVMRRGRIVGELSRAEATEERILRLATGAGA